MTTIALPDKRRIDKSDILSLDEYTRIRSQLRREIAELKRCRRLEVGPIASFHFENAATMWGQIQEMLYIEKGGEAQLEDELAAYNPLIPKGQELSATVMFEIDDPVRRARVLAQLGGIEDRAFIELAGVRIFGEPDPTRENTSPYGKASSVQFIRFRFEQEQIAAFRKPGAHILVGFDHPHYGHIATIPEAIRVALAEDFG